MLLIKPQFSTQLIPWQLVSLSPLYWMFLLVLPYRQDFSQSKNSPSKLHSLYRAFSSLALARVQQLDRISSTQRAFEKSGVRKQLVCGWYQKDETFGGAWPWPILQPYPLRAWRSRFWRIRKRKNQRKKSKLAHLKHFKLSFKKNQHLGWYAIATSQGRTKIFRHEKIVKIGHFRPLFLVELTC